MAELNGKGLTLLAIGGIVAFSGLYGKSVSQSVRAFVTGQSPTGTAQTLGLGTSADLSGNSDGATTQGTITAGVGLTGNAAANRGIGQLLAARYGWIGNEWTALDSLWSRESEWNQYADNPTSHAYGIPQALPASKLPHAGQPVSLGGSSSAVSQITWGLAYIKSVYGTPSAAWAHELANSWY